VLDLSDLSGVAQRCGEETRMRREREEKLVVIRVNMGFIFKKKKKMVSFDSPNDTKFKFRVIFVCETTLNG